MPSHCRLGFGTAITSQIAFRVFAFIISSGRFASRCPPLAPRTLLTNPARLRGRMSCSRYFTDMSYRLETSPIWIGAWSLWRAKSTSSLVPYRLLVDNFISIRLVQLPVNSFNIIYQYFNLYNNDLYLRCVLAFQVFCVKWKN